MVTLKQLAQQLSVSTSTVSKALNDSDEISSRTTLRVKELAQLQGYQPNKSAVSLKSRKTKTIGVIIPNILNRFFAKTLLGIEKEATNLGYNIITCISNESLTKEIDSINLLANGSVDGFILAVSEETQLKGNYDHFKKIINQGLPIVMFDRVLKEISCDKVIIDDADAIYKATYSIFRKGRNKIAFISTINDLKVGKLREHGYKNAIANIFGMATEPIILKIQSKENIQEEIRSFFLKNPNIDGVVAADNVSGTTTISVCNSLGYDLPTEISVLGFADNAIANLSVPKLSYIDQNAEEIGKNSASLLIQKLNNPENNKFTTKVIPTTLIDLQEPSLAQNT